MSKHNIETIIGLPANLFYGTGIPTIIMVLRKVREKDDILFIDASKGFIKDGNKNRLRQRDIRKIVDTVISRKSVDHYSRLVSFKEIEENEFNLNIPRYVDSSDKEDVHDIYALMFGGIPNSEIDDEKYVRFWTQFPKLRNELFKAVDSDYSIVSNENIKKLIENNTEIISFVKKHNDNFAYLKGYLDNEFFSAPDMIQINSLEMKIIGTLENKVDENGLIDYYDCYEVIDNAFQEILPDLEIFKDQGIAAAREIDEIKELKKDSNTKKLEEKVVGEDGRLIPFSMIRRIYFKDMSNELDALDSELSTLASEKNELLDSIDPNDKSELLKDGDSGDIDSKKLNAKISEIKRDIKKGAEYEEDSYESIILAVNETNEKIKKIKKLQKSLKTKLYIEIKKKIRSLTDDEIHDLLVMKWIDPVCEGINGLSGALISTLENHITSLARKYDTTYTELETNIDDAENSLALMMDDLTGNEFDVQGLTQLKKLFSCVSLDN